MNAPPLALYLHLPWCVQKCPYCDFNSYTAGADAPRERYVDAIVRDLALEAGRVPERDVTSVFIGGGTPSFFPPAAIARMLDAAAAHFRLAPDVEITMEANPGTIEFGDPAGYRAAGVNRLSIGAQSFSAGALKTLGRIHGVGDIHRAVSAARAAGFERLNLDLMHGLPGQDVDAALADLGAALALDPGHLSWYQLTLEPNTVFHARPPAGLPDDERAWAIQCAGHARLEGHGYRQYEVSAWSRPGDECRHNRNYWTFGDYLAIGAGAHGKLTLADGVRRYRKPANPLGYLDDVEGRDAPQPLEPPLPDEDRLFEFMLNALRLRDGFHESLLEERARLPAGRLAGKAAGAVDRGLIERSGAGHWRPTALGRRFLDDLQAAFLP